jgi:hypothetical protein
MRLIAFAAVMLALPTVAAADVDTILADAAKACAAQDNGTLTTEGAVKEVDLTGDGKPDTVVDEAFFKCSTSASLFNGGTGGSMVHFLADGSETARLVKGWDTANWADSTLILLALHGGECGGAGVDPCFEALTWGANAFVSVRPKQN